MAEIFFNPNGNLFDTLDDLVPWGSEKCSYKGNLKKLKSQYLMELKEKVYRNVFENSDGNIKIFGSPEELAKTVRGYQDFPGSGEFLEFDLFEPSERLVLWETTKGRKVALKSHIYDWIIFHCNKSLLNDLPFNRTLRCLMSYKINSDLVGFIRNNEFVFVEDIEDTVPKNVEALKDYIGDNPEGLQCFKQSGDYLANFLEGTIFEESRKLLKYAVDEICDYHSKNECVCIDFIRVWNRLEGFLMKNIEKISNFESVKNVAQVICDDDGKMYLLEKLKLDRKDGHRSLVKQRTRLIENPDTEMEFIRHNIIRTKHYTQPISVPDGRFFKPAADVLLQVLKGLFFGWKVFQRIEEDEFYVVEDALCWIEDYFTPAEKALYFLHRSDINQIREELEERFENLDNIDVDNIEIPEELTVDAVEKELTEQNFVEFFPDCLDFLKEYFDEETGPFSIFDVMTSCLTKSLCNRIPHLAEFLHNQGACQRIAKLQCCIGSATQADCREEPTDEACASNPQEPEIFEQCIEASETCIAKDKELTDAKNRISSLEMEMREKEQEAKDKFERMRKELEEERARFEREREELFQLQAEKDEVIQQLLTEKDEVIQQQTEKDEVIQQTRDELASMTGLKQNIQLQLNRVLLEKANVEIEKQKVDEINQSWQELIQSVRGHVNMETWNAVNFKLPVAMQPFLIDAQNRKRRLEECDWMAQAGHKVARFNLLTNEPDLHSFAQKHLAKFNEKFVVYKGQVEEQFARIQASNLLTPSEFSTLPDHPDLPKVFYDFFEVLHREDIATSCGICYSPPGDDPPSAWTQCNDARCSMKFHKECIQKCFDMKQNRRCILCCKDTNIET